MVRLASYRVLHPGGLGSWSVLVPLVFGSLDAELLIFLVQICFVLDAVLGESLVYFVEEQISPKKMLFLPATLKAGGS